MSREKNKLDPDLVALNIHIIWRIIEGFIKQPPLVATFIDFRKAFHSINRDSMFAILRNYGMLMLYEFYTTIQKAQSLLMGNCQRNSRLQPVSSKEDISISHFPLHHCFRVCNEKRNQKQSRRQFHDSSKKIQTTTRNSFKQSRFCR